MSTSLKTKAGSPSPRETFRTIREASPARPVAEPSRLSLDSEWSSSTAPSFGHSSP